MKKTIVIEIGTKGDVTIEPHGYGGVGCRDATAFLEEALGEVVSREDTAECFEVALTVDPAAMEQLE